MHPPACGIAGRTRGRRASLSSTASSSPPPVDDSAVGNDADGGRRRGVPQVHKLIDHNSAVAGRTKSRYKDSKRREEPGGGRDDGEEGRDKTAVDGRQGPPLHEHNTAVDGRQGPPLHELPVASRTRAKLKAFLARLQPQRPRNGGSSGPSEAAFEGFDLESSEDEEPTPAPTSSVEEGGSVEGRGGGEGGAVARAPAKRKWPCGGGDVVPTGGSASPRTEEEGIAKRTRSHFASGSAVKSGQQQPGSLTSPCIDDDDDDDFSEPDRRTQTLHSHGEHGLTGDHASGSALEGEVAEERSGSRTGGEFKAWDPRTARKRGRCNGRRRSFDPCRLILLDDIPRNDGEQTEAPKQRELPPPLPLVFSFGDEDPAVEKSEYERAIDSLWAEFDFAMGVTHLGSDHLDVHGEVDSSGTEAVPPCSHVDGHKMVLDERIGIICEHCSFLELEIRHVPPSLYKAAYRSGKPNWRSSRDEEEDASIVRALGEKPGAENDGPFDGPAMAYRAKGTVWDLVDPGVKGGLFPHQREGLEFIWRSMAGDIRIEKVRNSVASGAVSGGCVITHAPGTGKTRLAIVFLQTFLKLFPQSRPVVIAPSGMLLTWAEEFRKCGVGFPFHVFNDVKRWPAEPRVRRGGRGNSKGLQRHLRLNSWAGKGGDGVLGISYGLFQRLASDGGGGGGGGGAAAGETNEKVRRILLEKPGLLIFDEGHTARNERSSIWNVLQKVRTRCRVILSGTPFQNNLRELENVLCLVRPELSGKVSSCRAPRTTAAAANLQPFSGDGIKEISSLIRPYVHLHRGSILGNLPGLRQFLIFLNPPPRQRRLLRGVHTGFPRRNYMDYDYKANLASLHPSLLASVGRLSPEEESAIGGSLLEALREEAVRGNPREGAKTMFLVELVRLCASLGEKVLVFSQYREPLPHIKNQLLGALGWDEGRVLLMHGGLSTRERQSCIDDFNGGGAGGRGEVQVLLASIKACCEGISLVGASRVVLLDTVWNPSVERQAIGRAYRIGQRRVVFTYHLIAAETGELERYRAQLAKDTVGELVIPLRGGDGGGGGAGGGEGGGASSVHEDRVLREMREHAKLKDMFEWVVDNPREAMQLSDACDPIPG